MNVYAVINGKKREARLIEMLNYRARFYAARVEYGGEVHIVIRFQGVSGWRDWIPGDGIYKIEKPWVRGGRKKHVDLLPRL